MLETSMLGDEKLTFKDKDFTLIKKRYYDDVYIYKGESEILRIGPKSILEKEIKFQTYLIENEFPVAKIYEEGGFGESLYFFAEELLGEKPLIDLFIEDCEKFGDVSEESFEKFLTVIEKYLRAKFKTVKKGFDSEDVRKAMHISVAGEEFPELKEKLERFFEKFLLKFKDHPVTIEHNDLNAYNILEKGVIDFEGAYFGPFGYDVCVNGLHQFGWSKTKSERLIKYHLTQVQIDTYFSRLDALCVENNFPKLSPYASDFYIGRMIYHLTRMQDFPIIRALRYEKLNKMLDAYLNSTDVMSVIKTEI